MAANPTDDALARLKADWPQWQIWVVHRVLGGPLWCAQRWDGTGPVLNTSSPGQLAEALEAEVSR